MDAGISVRAPVGVVPTDSARPVVVAAPAAPTELAQAKTVAPVTETAPIRNDPIAAAEATMRQVVLDPQTREVVFRVIDAKSRQVVRQVPEEALLRLRAYTRAAEKGKNPADVLVQADVTA
jgi:hypothetical protein